MNENYSLADIAAATGNGGNSCNNGGFGGAWGEWILVFLIFALFGGWGNGGFGRGNSAGMDSYGGGMGAASGYVLASDFATIQRQLSDGFNTQERRTDAIINGTPLAAISLQVEAPARPIYTSAAAITWGIL